MIIRKSRGLWMIITALMPIIWILIFLNIIYDVSQLFNNFFYTINSSLNGIVTTLQQSVDSLNDSVEPIRNVQAYLSDVSQKISSIPDTIPRLNISVAGIKDLKNMLTNNFNILDKLSGVLEDITSIGQIQGYYQEIAIKVQQSIQELQIIGIKILVLIFLGVMIIIPSLIRLLITPYIQWACLRIRRGWQLICN